MIRPDGPRPPMLPPGPPPAPNFVRGRGGGGGNWPRGAPMMGGWIGHGDNIKHVGGNMVIYSPGSKKSGSRSR